MTIEKKMKSHHSKTRFVLMAFIWFCYTFEHAMSFVGHALAFVVTTKTVRHRSPLVVPTSSSSSSISSVLSSSASAVSSSSSSSSSALFMAGVNPGKRASFDHLEDDQLRMLEDFRTADGEVLNPYVVLKVSRDAGRQEIRQSYLALSKRYHPDTLRHKDILPGSCNNLEDVRLEWERIKMAYEILKDNKMRLRYDRLEVLVDPGAAMGRAATDAFFKGLSGFGRGLLQVGSFAAGHLQTQMSSMVDTFVEETQRQKESQQRQLLQQARLRKKQQRQQEEEEEEQYQQRKNVVEATAKVKRNGHQSNDVEREDQEETSAPHRTHVEEMRSFQ